MGGASAHSVHMATTIILMLLVLSACLVLAIWLLYALPKNHTEMLLEIYRHKELQKDGQPKAKSHSDTPNIPPYLLPGLRMKF